jgi:hypothetical protein
LPFSYYLPERETGQQKPFGSLPNMDLDYYLSSNGALAAYRKLPSSPRMATPLLSISTLVEIYSKVLSLFSTGIHTPILLD